MAPRSLKACALQWLAQREHSRSELRRKLLPHARAQDAVTREGAQAGSMAPGQGGAGGPELAPIPSAVVRVDAVLDWLEAHDYLSHERFAESRVHARASRFGNLRIRQELAQHQVSLSAEAAQALKDSELARAQAVWARKYAGVPATAAERARQARFLSGRGFSADTIRQVLRQAGRPMQNEDDPAFVED